MINIQQYKTIYQDINYLQNLVIFSFAKEIVIKHAKIIAEALRDDSALRTWCVNNYSRKHTVYSGIDKRYPPGEVNTPFVAVAAINNNSGYGMAEDSFLVSIVCGINDDTLISSEDTNNVTHRKYAGIEKSEEMRKLAETAAVGAIENDNDIGMAIIGSIESSYRTIESFPFFYNNSAISTQYVYSQGDAMFENRR